MGIPRESNRFAIEDDFNKTLVRLERQKFHLIWVTCVVILIVVVALFFLEYKVLQYIETSPDSAKVLIFLAR